jgi:hypothetical protein
LQRCAPAWRRYSGYSVARVTTPRALTRSAHALCRAREAPRPPTISRSGVGTAGVDVAGVPGVVGSRHRRPYSIPHSIVPRRAIAHGWETPGVLMSVERGYVQMPSSDLTALSKAAAALDTAAMNDHGVKWAQVKGHPFWCVGLRVRPPAYTLRAVPARAVRRLPRATLGNAVRVGVSARVERWRRASSPPGFADTAPLCHALLRGVCGQPLVPRTQRETVGWEA